MGAKYQYYGNGFKGRLACSSDGFSLFYNLHLRVGGEMLLKEEVAVCDRL